MGCNKMKKLRIFNIFMVFCLILSGFRVTSSAETIRENSLFEVLPYKEIKYVKSSGIVSGISPNTDLNDVLRVFKNSDDILVYDAADNQIKKGCVGTGLKFVDRNTNETATALVYGDINGDGKIDLIDFVIMRKHLANIVSLDNLQLKSIDINVDNTFDIKDILKMCNYLIKQTEIRNSSYYYVSKNGSDDNEGSIKSPFLSIQKAAEVMSAGDTCFIKEGVYRETVTPKNQGEEGAPVSFLPYENDKVTISGTETINSEWTEYKNGIYKTNCHIWRRTENQIFVNGEMAQIARYPNKTNSNPIDVGKVLSADTADAEHIEDSDLTAETDFFKGAKIFIEGTSHYIYYSSDVTSSKNGYLSFSSVIGGWDAPTSNSNYYLYNSLNLLDYENEWYYDGNGTLYYKPQGNVNPNDLSFEYSVRPEAFDVRDKAYITVKGLEIFGANVKTNSGSTNLNLDNDRILYYYHTMLSRVYPWEAEWYGIELWGKNSVVRNCEIGFGAEGGVEIYADNCSVVNNYIHDINYINSNAAAVEPKYCKNTLISHNTIDNVARSAIILACKNMRVSYNKISNCAVNCYDVSGIGSYKMDAENTVEVDHNLIYNCNNKHDFVAYYLDNGSLRFLVHHNVCYNVDLAMILNNPSYENKIYNNTFLSDKPIVTGNLQNPFEENAFVGAVWTGDQFYNNILPSLYYGEGAYYSNNLLSTNTALKLNKDCTLQADSLAVDKGINLPIEQEISGNAVDIGAYEYGKEKWTAGQNTRENSTEFSLSQVDTSFTPTTAKPFLEMVNANGTDLVSEPGFESDTVGFGGFNYSRINLDVSSGEYAMKIQNGWIEKTVDVTSGQMYYYKGDIKLQNFGTVSEFGVHFMDNNYNILKQGAFMVSATEYKNFETIFSVPENCTKMRIFVAGWGDNSVVFADNIQCTLIS